MIKNPMPAVFTIGLAAALVNWGQAQRGSGRPSFEVATVKLLSGNCHTVESPGLISRCGTLANYIQVAYNLSAHGPARSTLRRLEIVGGPAWVGTDLYAIVAKAPDPASSLQMYGPMMQTLLEERFRLRVRQEMREEPVYVLTVNKGGPKIKPLSEGGCVKRDYNADAGEDGANDCGKWSAFKKPNSAGGLNISMDSHGETFAQFAGDLSNLGSDRVVIDETGATAMFNIHLEFSIEGPAGDTSRDGSGESPRESLFTAVREQLGLKLTAGKRPVEVLVIDHVERPAGN